MFEFRPDGILRVTVAAGRPGETLAAAMRDPRFRPGMPILIDRREMPLPTPGYASLIAAWWRTHGDTIGRSPVALVARSDAAFGMARITEALLTNTRRTVRVFHTEEDAVAWLNDV